MIAIERPRDVFFERRRKLSPIPHFRMLLFIDIANAYGKGALISPMGNDLLARVAKKRDEFGLGEETDIFVGNEVTVDDVVFVDEFVSSNPHRCVPLLAASIRKGFVEPNPISVVA